MPFTGERFVPELRGQIYYEHLHRYALGYELARDLDVLDIASGEGYGAAHLARIARSVTGVDNDADTVRHAAARYTAMNLSFRVGSCTHIPLADRSIDLAISFETLEHIEEHQQFLSEIVRVLRPNGRFLLSSPNKLVYSDLDDYENPFHVRELYFDELRELLKAWFPNVAVYGQRLFAGSAVHPLHGVEKDARCIGPTRDTEWGLPALPGPKYFVALCDLASTQPDQARLVSVFIDPRDDLLEHFEHSAAPASELLDGGAMLQLTPEAGVAQPFEAVAIVPQPRSDVEDGLRAQLNEGERERVSLTERIAALERAAAAEASKHEVLALRIAELEASLVSERALGARLQAQLQTEAVAADEAKRLEAKRFDDERQATRAAEQTLRARIAELEAAVDAQLQRAAESEAARRAAIAELEAVRSAAAAEADALSERVRGLDDSKRELAQAERLVRAERDAARADFDSLRLAYRETARELALENDRARTLDERAALAEAHVTELQQRCSSVERTNRVLERAAADGITRRGEDEARATELARDLDRARVELVSAVAELAQTRADLDAIVGSRSWRLTRPVRVAMRSLRGD